MLRRAASSDAASRPMWWTRAPQQPSPFAKLTSYPARTSRRTVASRTCGCSTGSAHPCSRTIRSLAACGETLVAAAGRRMLRGAKSSMAARGLSAGARASKGPAGLARRASVSANAEPAWIGKHGDEKGADRALGQRPPVARLDVGAGVIDQVHVVHARGAGGHARQAREATVDVLDHLGGGLALALQHLLDQVDAPARAIEFVAEQHIGRTRGRAEAAVYALADHRLGRRHGRIGELFGREVSAHGVGPGSVLSRTRRAGRRRGAPAPKGRSRQGSRDGAPA